MKLTPLDIRHKEFRRTVRGYSDEEVDVFLDEVADEFERLFQENIDSRERIEHLGEQLAHHEGLRDTLQQTLISAQQQAEEMKANARKEAELVLKDAGLQARDIVNESYQEKQSVQQSLIQLKQAEEDFRFKFRSLLEAHINLLSEEENSEERRRFEGVVSGVEEEEEDGEEAVAPAPAADAPEEDAAGQPSEPEPEGADKEVLSEEEIPSFLAEGKEVEPEGAPISNSKEALDTGDNEEDAEEDAEEEEEDDFFNRGEDRDFRW